MLLLGKSGRAESAFDVVVGVGAATLSVTSVALVIVIVVVVVVVVVLLLLVAADGREKTLRRRVLRVSCRVVVVRVDCVVCVLVLSPERGCLLLPAGRRRRWRRWC